MALYSSSSYAQAGVLQPHVARGLRCNSGHAPSDAIILRSDLMYSSCSALLLAIVI